MLTETRTRTVTVTNVDGLHARPCVAIVKTVSRHQANVTTLFRSDIGSLLKKGTGSARSCTFDRRKPLLLAVPVPFFSRLIGMEGMEHWIVRAWLSSSDLPSTTSELRGKCGQQGDFRW